MNFGLWRWLWLLCWALLLPSSALAQSSFSLLPELGPHGLPELGRTARPRFEPGLRAAWTGGYGVTETVDQAPGPHHRLDGSLAVSIAPMSWLAFALRMDGRLDMHPDDGMGAHGSAVGDPRVLARAGYPLADHTELGLELAVWVPGEQAPSLALDATSPSARVLFAHAWPREGWSLLAAVGYRLDNSASAAPRLSGLRPGDRLSLGLSEFDAVLAAVGAARRLGSDAEIFGELSADLLPRAPDVLTSPLRATVGARYRMSRELSGEVAVQAALGKRPGIGLEDPLVPIEPRALLTVGLRYGHFFRSPPPAPTTPNEPVPPTPSTVVVTGQLLDDAQQPLIDARVTLHGPDGTQREVFTDAQGRYRFEDVPVGEIELTAEAPGFETKRWTLRLGPRSARIAPRSMAPQEPTGVIRGLTRSFESEPLEASIDVVNDETGETVASVRADADGHFEVSVSPGSYRVTIRAPGHRMQERGVRIRDGSVAILNVDLRERE